MPTGTTRIVCPACGAYTGKPTPSLSGWRYLQCRNRRCRRAYRWRLVGGEVQAETVKEATA